MHVVYSRVGTGKSSFIVLIFVMWVRASWPLVLFPQCSCKGQHCVVVVVLSSSNQWSQVGWQGTWWHSGMWGWPNNLWDPSPSGTFWKKIRKKRGADPTKRMGPRLKWSPKESSCTNLIFSVSCVSIHSDDEWRSYVLLANGRMRIIRRNDLFCCNISQKKIFKECKEIFDFSTNIYKGARPYRFKSIMMSLPTLSLVVDRDICRHVLECACGKGIFILFYFIIYFCSVVEIKIEKK